MKSTNCHVMQLAQHRSAKLDSDVFGRTLGPTSQSPSRWLIFVTCARQMELKLTGESLTWLTYIPSYSRFFYCWCSMFYWHTYNSLLYPIAEWQTNQLLRRPRHWLTTKHTWPRRQQQEHITKLVAKTGITFPLILHSRWQKMKTNRCMFLLSVVY